MISVRDSVRRDADFNRIWSLPIRKGHDWGSTAAQLTKAFRRPGGTMEIRPHQAQMAIEAYDNGGLFAAAPVGSGKTLPSFLIPTFFGAQRPLLLLRASLKPQAVSDLLRYGQHFRLATNIKMLTYELLSQPDAQEILYKLQPDLVILDEAQKLKNLSTARARRFFQYVEDMGIRLVCLSGSMVRKRLRDFHHLMVSSLPDGAAPIPYDDETFYQWSQCLDTGVESFERAHPGPLMDLAERFHVPPSPDWLERARQGFARRMESTPGVVVLHRSSCSTPLKIRERSLPVPKIISDAMDTLRQSWEAPNGDECDSKLELWRYMRELACGFYSIWDPPPPKAWLAARKAWRRFVRDVLKRGDSKLDSPFHVANAYEDHPLHVAWKEIEPTYEPETIPVWVDDFLVRDAAEWLRRTGGIAWVEHITVGEHIAAAAGVRYYGGGPASARDILHAKGPIVCSIHAHREGRNLQRYTDNLIVSCIPSGDAWEQTIGRSHRDGQDLPVNAEVYLHCQELRESLLTAVEDARYTRDIMGQDQKLLLAEIEVEGF